MRILLFYRNIYEFNKLYHADIGKEQQFSRYTGNKPKTYVCCSDMDIVEC